MHFIVTGYDGVDEQALSRRMAAREAHLAGADAMRSSGTLLFAAAMLDDAGQMIGSTLIMDFPSRDHLDAWLKMEPYVCGDVWRRTEITPCKIAPGFSK